MNKIRNLGKVSYRENHQISLETLKKVLEKSKQKQNKSKNKENDK